MSLINDALKRANQAQKKRPPVGPLGVPLQPADASPARHWMPVALVTAVLMVALGGAVWLGWVGWQSLRKPGAAATVASPPPKPQSAESVAPPKPPPAKAAPKVDAAVQSVPVTRQTSPTLLPPVLPKPVPPVAAAPENPPPAPPVTAVVRVPPPVLGKTEASSPKAAPTVETPASSKPAVPTVEAPPPAKPPFPELKLQGIFYLASRPSALISGKTVFRGDIVLGAKVVSIEKLSVTLEFEGETKVLSLE